MLGIVRTSQQSKMTNAVLHYNQHCHARPRAYITSFHQTVQQGGAESCVQLTPKGGGGHIEAAAHLSLCEAVHELSGVVC